MRNVMGLCLAALLLLGGPPAATAAQAPIKIGFFGPLTGSVAADGISARHAVELAAQEVNGRGGLLGRPVELVVYDDHLNPQEAVAIAHKLIEKDQVIGVVSGAFSGPSRVTAPLFAKARVPMVTGYAVHPDVTRGSDSNFRIGFLGQIIRPPNEVSTLIIENDTVWTGGKDGVILIDRLTGARISTPLTMPSFGYVRQIIQDRNGGIWIGHDGGLACFRQGSWQVIAPAPHVPFTRVLSIVEQQDGTIVIGTDTDVLGFKGDSWTSLLGNNAPPLHPLTSCLWLAGATSGSAAGHRSMVVCTG